MGEEKRPQRKDTWLEIDKINVLPQVRRTFDPEDIRTLAESICDWNGLLERIIVIIYSKKLCQEYIDLTNKIHKSCYQINKLVPMSDGQFAILASGEQRLRAHLLIWIEGCSICRAKYGQEKPGTCFARHVSKEKRIEVSLRYNIPVFRAIDLQIAGNSGIHPPEHETMEVLVMQFRLKREINPKLTIAEFARSINKNPSTISDYLKVFELPERVFYYFREEHISFGIAREIAFLKDQGENDNNLEYWVLQAITKQMKVDVFHKLIREYLIKKKQSIIEIFEEGSKRASQKIHIRKTVAAEMVAYLHAKDAHWRKFLQLYEEGKLGKEDSAFSMDSPRNLFKKEIDFVKNHITPHMRLHLPQKSLKDIEKVLTRMELNLIELEKKMEKKKIKDKK